MDREDKVRKIFITGYISIVCLTGSETISIHKERLQLSEAGRKPIIFKCENALVHNLEQKKVLNFYLLYKLLYKFGDKSHNS